MINILTSQNLNIISTNTNKALEQVVKNASPKELEILSKGKNLKSIMGDILKQSANNSTSNKTLLELVKNNPTLKNLGDVSSTAKDLLNSIDSNKNLQSLEKVLKSVFSDVKDLKDSKLESNIKNSGVFLESKLKDVKNPQVELKTTLKELKTILQKSELPTSKTILKDINNILKNEILTKSSNSDLTKPTTSNPKELETLTSSLKELTTKLSNTLKNSDSLLKPTVLKILDKLNYQISKEVLTPQNFKLPAIKESLEQLNTQLSKSLTSESKELVKTLTTILKDVEGEPSLEKFIEKKTPQKIQILTKNIQDITKESDIVFSKDTTKILKKLNNLTQVEKLNVNSNLKEVLSNDLKSVLLQTKEELVKTNTPNQNEILKHIDKLSLQIDHYQLLSHLSNSSALYLPFSWDSLDDGNIEFKTKEKDKFYCDIHLKLKEYGELNLKLTLFEKNQLNLQILSSNEEFKTKIKENIPTLRSALIDIQITPREIRILTPKKNQTLNAYQTYQDDFKMGFEVKG